MDVLVTCKYEEDPIKNEGARVDTTLYSNFSDAQGQITLVLVSVSGRNLNSSKLSCMSQQCHNIFPIITLWELFVAMETRVPILPGPKSNAINSPPQ